MINILVCIVAVWVWLSDQGRPLLQPAIKRLFEHPQTVARLVSPDHVHVAEVQISLGSSGVTSTWCEMAVLVGKLGREGKPSWGYRGNPKKLAYSGQCDFDPDHRPENVRWQSATRLEIAIDRGIADPEGKAVLRNNVEDEAVQVIYIQRKGSYPF